MMKPETRDSSAKRLARIEGQVRGVAKMIEEGRYCIDVVRQLQAVKAALGAVEAVILEDHVATCVDDALAGDNVEKRREKVEELVAVLAGRRK